MCVNDQCIKMVVLGVFSLIIFCDVTLIGVAAYLQHVLNQLYGYEQRATIMCICSLCLSSIMVIVGIAAVFAVIRECKMLCQFVISLLFLIAFGCHLVLGAVTTKLIERHPMEGVANIETYTKTYMRDLIVAEEYWTRDKVKESVDYIQSSWECCGTIDQDPWKIMNATKDSPAIYRVPDSCCDPYFMSYFKRTCVIEVTFRIGCTYRVSKTLQRFITVLRNMNFTYGCLKVVGAFFVHMYIFASDRHHRRTKKMYYFEP